MQLVAILKNYIKRSLEKIEWNKKRVYIKGKKTLNKLIK